MDQNRCPQSPESARGVRKLRVRDAIGSPEFMTTYNLWIAGDTPSAPGLDRVRPNTLGWLVGAYQASNAFARLEPSTRSARTNVLASLLVEPLEPGSDTLFREFPLAEFTARSVRVLRDRKMHAPAAANERLKLLRVAFAWAAEEDVYAGPNVAVGVSPVKPTREGGHHSWTDEEVEAFERRHPVGTQARLALDLFLYLGVRISDAVRIGRPHEKNGVIKCRQFKGRNRKGTPLIEMPILPCLQATIAASAIGELTYLQTEWGRPFSTKGFGNKFRNWCDEAGLPHCSAHGLRKCGATRSANQGATTQQLMAIFGWLSIDQAERYTKDASRAGMARMAAHTMGRDAI